MKKKLTLQEIDKRNSKVLLPDLSSSQVDPDQLHYIFITRRDGTAVSAYNATSEDMDWLHESQLRHLERHTRFGIVR